MPFEFSARQPVPAADAATRWPGGPRGTWPSELKKRIWFTLAALVVCRLGTYVPLPGIDPVALDEIFWRESGGLIGLLDMFSGGALSRMTIFALGVIPYITAAIVMLFVARVVPTLEKLKKEGETGRKKINQYTRYLTVLLAMVQGYAIAVGLERSKHQFRRSGRHESGFLLRNHHGRHHRRRHDVPDVDGRADHPARRRQRHFADHLRGHRRQPAGGAGADT
jgi:hypothetical protein